jgi:hypothetical protein
VGFSGLAVASINDRDTLAFETKNVNALQLIEKAPNEEMKSREIINLVILIVKKLSR